MPVQDANLISEKALPASNTTATLDSLDLGAMGALAAFPGDVEFKLSVESLNVTQLPNGNTMKLAVVNSDASNLSGSVTLMTDAIVQTGAGGAGSAAKEVRFRLPRTVKRYLGATATNSGATDCSAKKFRLEAEFFGK